MSEQQAAVVAAAQRLRDVAPRLMVRSSFLEDLATVLDAVDTFTKGDGSAAMADGTVLGRRTVKSLGLCSGEQRDDSATWTPPEGVDLPTGWTGEGTVDVDVDTSEATAILRRIEAQLDIAVSTLTRKRTPTPGERPTGRQWDPGPQPSEYGDERTEPRTELCHLCGAHQEVTPGGLFVYHYRSGETVRPCPGSGARL